MESVAHRLKSSGADGRLQWWVTSGRSSCVSTRIPQLNDDHGEASWTYGADWMAGTVRSGVHAGLMGILRLRQVPFQLRRNWQPRCERLQAVEQLGPLFRGHGEPHPEASSGGNQVSADQKDLVSIEGLALWRHGSGADRKDPGLEPSRPWVSSGRPVPPVTSPNS